MADNAISPAKFAGLVGDVSESGVVKWVRRERVPRADQLRKIHTVTGGLVTPNDFILNSGEVTDA